MAVSLFVNRQKMTESIVEDIVTFHPGERLIKIRPEAVRPDGIIVIDAVKDIYSAWKRWAASSEGIVFGEIVKAKGGIVLPSGFRTETHIILQEGWKVQCPNNVQTVELYGNLHSSDSEDPIARRPDGHKVVVKSISRVESVRNKAIYWFSLIFITVGILLLFLWIYDTPKNIEPYATLAVVLFTLFQFIGQGRR